MSNGKKTKQTKKHACQGRIKRLKMTNRLRRNQVPDRPEEFVRARKRNRDKGYALVLLCCV